MPRLSGGRRLAALAALAIVVGLPVVLAPAPAAAQTQGPPVRVVLADPGPGEAGRVLRAVLARPHVAVAPAVPTLGLPRDTTFDATIVIVGADATVASHVRGDVVVVGGDLFLHPGADIEGRAMAFGGGVYNSLLARVQGGLFAYRDVHFAIAPAGDVVTLAYRRPEVEGGATVVLPGLYGLRIPEYDRSDGLVLPLGPRVVLAGGRVDVDAVVSYRSHLGAVDPWADARVGLDGRTDLELSGGRTTRSNDDWARADWVNTIASFVYGDDERNHYRSTEFAARLRRGWELTSGIVEPWIGIRTEDARSVGPAPGDERAPWTVVDRHDPAAILRPNPEVAAGRISAGEVGVRASYDDGEMRGRGSLRVELPWDVPGDARFGQATFDGQLSLPTFRTQRLALEAHAVVTAGDVAPAQRFAYLGGGSTLPTLDELSMGGDQLLYLAGTYLVPLGWPRLPYVGGLTLGARYAVGSAGVDRLPDFVQNVGARLALGLLRVDYLVDPATGDRSVSFGVSMP
ncbi:MAG TPA: hypothetical protein VFS08_19895 [Gemmatimonadaceae bacterium]|nr:hypothetical protein [Gemmatimonadaceae bacterium]